LRACGKEIAPAEAAGDPPFRAAPLNAEGTGRLERSPLTHVPPNMSPDLFEFLDRRHQPHQELEVGFDRGAGPAGVVGHIVQKTGPGLAPWTQDVKR
jgi:hypothetical protein